MIQPTIQLVTPTQFLGGTVVFTAVSFATGALYAAITKGPVVLTGSVTAITVVASFAIGALLTALAKNNLISAKTFTVLSNANGLLCGTAGLVAGISLGIFGPVYITITSIGLAYCTLMLLKSLITPKEDYVFAPAPA